jgi:tetratricopeptide (TPR) repeat protein
MTVINKFFIIVKKRPNCKNTVSHRHMKRLFCLTAYVFLAIVSAQAQVSGNAASLTALQNYWQGRDREAADRMSEATVFYNEAIRIALDEVSRNVATGDTYAALTWAMQRQNRFAEVITWGQRALRAFPNEYRIMETMGEAYFYLDDYGNSMAFMQRYVHALPQGNRASVAFFFMGEIFRITGKPRHADIAYTTALHLGTGLPVWWYRLGAVREAVGDRALAIEAYQETLRLNANHQEARSGLARLQQR